MTHKDVESMWLVGGLGRGNWAFRQVELFSDTEKGTPKVVYVYSEASPEEVRAAKEKAAELNIPILFAKEV